MLSLGSVPRARIPLPQRSGVLAGRLLVVLILFTALASVSLAQQTVHLEGKVRTDAGDTIRSGITVRLENDEGQLVSEQPANSEGAFDFPYLRKVNYRLIVTADGFEPYQEPLDLSYGPTIQVVSVTLRPTHKVTVGPSAAARTDNLAPKNAKKEYEQAGSDLAAKNVDGARTHLEAAVREYPCYARAQTDLATVLEARRDLRGAETALKKARECDPDYIDSYIVLGQMLNSERRFADSEQVLQEGVRRSPGSWQFYYQLGVAHFGLAEYPKAQSEYERVLELNPFPPAEFHVKIADLYLKEKSYDKAYSNMDEYLRAEPDGRFAAKIKNIMQQMKASGVLSQPEAARP
jgi:tetratricopeptide (TPR) repeat protein